MNSTLINRLLVFFFLSYSLIAFCAIHANAQGPPQITAPLGIYNIVQRVDVAESGLVAIVNNPQGEEIAIPFNLTSQGRRGGSCAILNLELGPIELDLLGLNILTSPICLDITGQRGRGNLLGNLLCSIAGLLDRGISLNQVLGGLTVEELNLLQTGLTDIINGALNTLNQAEIVDVQQDGNCTILFLSLGPLDLNLLGLRVELNDCEGGPVTIDITADPEGGLLGSLLCGLLGPIVLPDTVNTLQDLMQFLFGELSNI
jgi:hypothetical protein